MDDLFQQGADFSGDRRIQRTHPSMVSGKAISAISRTILNFTWFRSKRSTTCLNGLVTLLRACGPAGGSVATGMKKISYRGYRFPSEIIQQAIWLYLRFTLSFRDVEDLLAERGIMVSYLRWVIHFGPMIAADLRKRRPKPHTTWHLDEVYLKIAGRMVYLWRAVDAEGEVLDVLVQSRLTSAFSFPLLSRPCTSVCKSGLTGLQTRSMAAFAKRFCSTPFV